MENLERLVATTANRRDAWTQTENAVLLAVKQNHLLGCGERATWKSTYDLYKSVVKIINQNTNAKLKVRTQAAVNTVRRSQ